MEWIRVESPPTQPPLQQSQCLGRRAVLQEEAGSCSLPAGRKQGLTQSYVLPLAWREVRGGPRLEGAVPPGSATALQVHCSGGDGPFHFTLQNFTDKI